MIRDNSEMAPMLIAELLERLRVIDNACDEKDPIGRSIRALLDEYQYRQPIVGMNIYALKRILNSEME